MGCEDLAVVPPLWFAGMLTRSDSPLGLPQSWPINCGQQTCRQATEVLWPQHSNRTYTAPAAAVLSTCITIGCMPLGGLDLQGHLLPNLVCVQQSQQRKLCTACHCSPLGDGRGSTAHKALPLREMIIPWENQRIKTDASQLDVQERQAPAMPARSHLFAH